MVAADQSDALRIAHLKSKQQKESFNRVVSTIDEITHEEVVRIWALTTDLEKLHQVIELTVNVTANL